MPARKTECLKIDPSLYDTLSRMKTASYFDVNTSGAATASNRFNETLTYDLRGNIGTLQRQGFIQSTCNFGLPSDH